MKVEKEEGNAFNKITMLFSRKVNKVIEKTPYIMKKNAKKLIDSAFILTSLSIVLCYISANSGKSFLCNKKQ